MKEPIKLGLRWDGIYRKSEIRNYWGKETKVKVLPPQWYESYKLKEK